TCTKVNLSRSPSTTANCSSRRLHPRQEQALSRAKRHSLIQTPLAKAGGVFSFLNRQKFPSPPELSFGNTLLSLYRIKVSSRIATPIALPSRLLVVLGSFLLTD